MYYLYAITNLLNKKIYIGQSNKENERWRQHKYFAKQINPTQYIHLAIAKYGVENFTYEVIAMCKTQEDVDDTEIKLIAQYDACNKEKGYNIALGGNHVWNAGLPKEQQPMYGKKQSEFQKQRMSEIHTGKTVIHSQEWKDHISQIMTGRKITWKDKISKSNMGKTLSQESKDKMSKSKIGKRYRAKFTDAQEIEIVQLSEQGLSSRKVAKIYNCSSVTICNIIKRRKKL